MILKNIRLTASASHLYVCVLHVHIKQHLPDELGFKANVTVVTDHTASSPITHCLLQNRRGGEDRQLKKVTLRTPLKTTFYTSFDSSSSLRQRGFVSDTSPGSPKSLHILSGQYFHSGFCPAALTFLLWSVPTPQPQPTLTRLQRAAERNLIHSSSALPRHVRCCWTSGWLRESFVGFFFFFF